MSTLATLDQRLHGVFASHLEAMRDPYTIFNDLRDHAPVFEFESAVLVSSHEEARLVIRDPRFGKQLHNADRAQRARAQLTREQQRAFDLIAAFESLQVVSSDPPLHDRLRRVAHRAFTPARITAFEASISGYVDQLLEPLPEQGVVDLSNFAYSIPLMVISDMLGVPHRDGEMIHGWTMKIAQNKGSARIDPDVLLSAASAVEALKAYVLEIYEQTRRSGLRASDLVADLMDAEQEERLSLEEMVSMFGMMIFAGHETSTNLIGIGIFELLRNRDQWEALCDDPDLAPQATEELLRYVSPVQWLSRVAREDCDLRGHTVAAGTTVLPVLASANRDPLVFDEPDRLDIRRADAHRHLSLGFGLHFCLGASLARLEAVIAFRTLARRFPDMELAMTPDAEEWKGNVHLRTLGSLPVHLGTDHTRV